LAGSLSWSWELSFVPWNGARILKDQALGVPRIRAPFDVPQRCGQLLLWASAWGRRWLFYIGDTPRQQLRFIPNDYRHHGSSAGKHGRPNRVRDVVVSYRRCPHQNLE
jgi:hypothetical protein